MRHAIYPGRGRRIRGFPVASLLRQTSPKGAPVNTYTIVSFAGNMTWWRVQFIMRDRVTPQVFDEGPGPYCRVSFGE